MNKQNAKGNNPVLIEKFRERLRFLMDQADSQEAFANFVGVSRSTLAQYYNNSVLPKADSIFKICSACHVSADWLLGLSGVKSPDIELQAVCKYLGLSEDAVAFLRMMNEHMGIEFSMSFDALLSNDKSRSSFLLSLMYLYSAYKIKKENENKPLREIDGIGKDILSIWIRDDVENKIDYKKYQSNKCFNEALETLFQSDSLLALYQMQLDTEESENGQS